MASAVTTNDSSPRSDAEVPPIVEVIIDTSSAKDIESLIDLVYEKQIVREEDSLSRHEQMIVDVVELKAEVENGGFQQFFSNPSGDRIHATIAALECISADQSLAILKKACSLFADSQPSSDGEKRFDQMEALKDQGDQQWDELDTEFYNVDEDLNQLLWDYWKKSDP